MPAQAKNPVKKDPANIEVYHRLPRQTLTRSQRLADWMTKWGGSWHFIGGLLVILFVWMTINIVLVIELRWDPYPFILLNLFLSCIAALQAPVILMSQNRELERDRLKIERDFAINRKAEREIEDIQKDLEEIKQLIRTGK